MLSRSGSVLSSDGVYIRRRNVALKGSWHISLKHFLGYVFVSYGGFGEDQDTRRMLQPQHCSYKPQIDHKHSSITENESTYPKEDEQTAITFANQVSDVVQFLEESICLSNTLNKQYFEQVTF